MIYRGNPEKGIIMLVDWERVNSVMMADEDDKEWFNEMMDTLKDNMKTRLENISKHVQDKDQEPLRKELHQVKGMSANFGLAEINKISATGEAYAKTGKVDEAIAEAVKLPDLWDKTLKELNAKLG